MLDIFGVQVDWRNVLFSAIIFIIALDFLLNKKKRDDEEDGYDSDDFECSECNFPMPKSAPRINGYHAYGCSMHHEGEDDWGGTSNG